MAFLNTILEPIGRAAQGFLGRLLDVFLPPLQGQPPRPQPNIAQIQADSARAIAEINAQTERARIQAQRDRSLNEREIAQIGATAQIRIAEIEAGVRTAQARINGEIQANQLNTQIESIRSTATIRLREIESRTEVEMAQITSITTREMAQINATTQIQMASISATTQTQMASISARRDVEMRQIEAGTMADTMRQVSAIANRAFDLGQSVNITAGPISLTTSSPGMIAPSPHRGMLQPHSCMQPPIEGPQTQYYPSPIQYHPSPKIAEVDDWGFTPEEREEALEEALIAERALMEKGAEEDEKSLSIALALSHTTFFNNGSPQTRQQGNRDDTVRPTSHKP